MGTIGKPPYPWPGRSAVSYNEFGQLIRDTQQSVVPGGQLTNQSLGGTQGIGFTPEIGMQFAKLMTQAEIDADARLDGQEVAGLLLRQSFASGQGHVVDDDQMSAWCYPLILSRSSNARVKLKHQPILVYFPQIPVIDGAGPSENCEVMEDEEILVVAWSHSDGRWAAVRQQIEKSIMDVVQVCDEDMPVEGCDLGGGAGESAFCCLFDGAAFRMLPDCEGEAGAGYFCNPDTRTFDVWIYSPDKRALPPEGTCDWGKRIQDAYTVSWKPLGEDGPTIEDTRPVYQIAACVCNCPTDRVNSVEFWCLSDPSESVRALNFGLRRTDPRDPNAEDVVAYEGEFQMAYGEYPQVGLLINFPGCIPEEGEDEDEECIRLLTFDAGTGDPVESYFSNGTSWEPGGAMPTPDMWDTMDDQGMTCETYLILDEQSGELLPSRSQSFWYRLHMECTPASGDQWEGFPPVVHTMDITLLVPPGHYLYNKMGINPNTGRYDFSYGNPQADCHDEATVVTETVQLCECGTPVSMTTINPCMGRTVGMVLNSKMQGNAGLDPCYPDTEAGDPDRHTFRHPIYLQEHFLGGCVDPRYFCPDDAGECGNVPATNQSPWDIDKRYSQWSLCAYNAGAGSQAWIATGTPRWTWNNKDKVWYSTPPGQDPAWVHLTYCMLFFKINYACNTAPSV